jgi:hypothetical protein
VRSRTAPVTFATKNPADTFDFFPKDTTISKNGKITFRVTIPEEYIERGSGVLLFNETTQQRFSLIPVSPGVYTTGSIPFPQSGKYTISARADLYNDNAGTSTFWALNKNCVTVTDPVLVSPSNIPSADRQCTGSVIFRKNLLIFSTAGFIDNTLRVDVLSLDGARIRSFAVTNRNGFIGIPLSSVPNGLHRARIVGKKKNQLVSFMVIK